MEQLRRDQQLLAQEELTSTQLELDAQPVLLDICAEKEKAQQLQPMHCALLDITALLALEQLF